MIRKLYTRSDAVCNKYPDNVRSVGLIKMKLYIFQVFKLSFLAGKIAITRLKFWLKK